MSDAMHNAIKHLRALDGWRGISILLVLLTHLAPLGGKVNFSLGLLGMVLFFNLSGFLITSVLLQRGATVGDFLVRRFFRIIPLTFAYYVVVFLFQRESMHSWIAHFLFFANLPPKQIRLATDHMWSLCVEVQFYVGMALLFGLLKKRGLLLLPWLAIAFTLFRVAEAQYDSTITWFRVDEILAGCVLALAYHGRLGPFGERLLAFMRSAPQWPLLFLLLVSCFYGLGYAPWIGYLRPYLAALLVGSTLLDRETSLARSLDNRALTYLASVSFALYVLHIGLVHTWLGSGDLVEKYAKRPLLLLVLFALAHLSTYYFEHPMIAVGKRLAQRLRGRQKEPPRENGAATSSTLPS